MLLHFFFVCCDHCPLQCFFAAQHVRHSLSQIVGEWRGMAPTKLGRMLCLRHYVQFPRPFRLQVVLRIRVIQGCFQASSPVPLASYYSYPNLQS